MYSIDELTLKVKVLVFEDLGEETEGLNTLRDKERAIKEGLQGLANEKALEGIFNEFINEFMEEVTTLTIKQFKDKSFLKEWATSLLEEKTKSSKKSSKFEIDKVLNNI